MMMMEEGVYILCSLTAAACSGLLFRGYFRSRSRLLLWCALFFGALALENMILFLDFIVVPDVDLSLIHRSMPLLGIGLLLYGLIWDVK
jgi:hypothetical protein